jgi:hypothetical protein
MVVSALVVFTDSYGCYMAISKWDRARHVRVVQ